MENLTDDFYEFIGVKRDATSNEINAACKRLLMKYHPDKCKDVWADGITKRINEIKEVLLDAEKRKEYDKKLSEPKDSKQEEQEGRERKEAEEKARKEAEEKARKKAEEKARKKAEEKAKHDALKKLAIGIILCFLTLGGIALMSGNDGSQSEVPQAPTDTIASNVNDMNSTGTINVIKKPVLPVADFYADRTSGEAPLTVQFYDISTGSPDSWNWNFGDKVTSTKQNPTHIYETAGVYTVTETVTNKVGEGIELKTNYITVMPSVNTDTASDNTGTDLDTGTVSDKGTGSDIGSNSGSDNGHSNTGSDNGKASDKGTGSDIGSNSGSDNGHSNTGSGSGTPIASLPTKSEVLTFVNEYQGASDFIETISGDSKSDHPEWKWDIWQDQNGNKVISFYYYQNNPKGYESTYFDSEGNIISTKDLDLTLMNSYKGA